MKSFERIHSMVKGRPNWLFVFGVLPVSASVLRALSVPNGLPDLRPPDFLKVLVLLGRKNRPHLGIGLVVYRLEPLHFLQLRQGRIGFNCLDARRFVFENRNQLHLLLPCELQLHGQLVKLLDPRLILSP
jgi:hypothetical protein